MPILGGSEMCIFFFKQKTAYEIMPSLVGSEMCIRDRCNVMQGMLTLSVIIYGLSDVIFFGKEAVIIFSTALILSILYQKIVIHKDENHE